MSTDWWSAGQRWLEQQALKEADAQRRAWVKGGRSAKTFRYNPPEWHRDAVTALGRNDEETFKAIKLDQLGTQGLPPLRAPKRHHATKKSPAQLQREIDEVLAKPSGSTQRDRQLAEAIDSGSRERAAELYGIWTSQYSNEDFDRVSSLAGRLTDIDRQEGRAAPPVGSSRLRLDQAKQVVRDANSYGAFQQGLSAQRRAKRRA